MSKNQSKNTNTINSFQKKVKNHNPMHQGELRYYSQMSAHLHMKQMMTLGASTSAKMLAHEVQNVYLLARKSPQYRMEMHACVGVGMTNSTENEVLPF